MHTKFWNLRGTYVQGSAIPEFTGVFNLNRFEGLAIAPACDAVDEITIKEFFKMEKPDTPLFFSGWHQICLINDHGIAHRNVWTENVLIEKDGEIMNNYV